MKARYQLIALLVVALLGSWYAYAHREVFRNLSSISLPALAFLFLAILAFQLVGALKLRYLIGIFDVDMSFVEWFGLTICNTMFNYYLPAQGGTAVRAFYLNKRYGLKYAHYGSLLAGSYVVFFVLSAGVGLVLSTALLPFKGRALLPLVAIFAGLILLTMGGSVLFKKVLGLGDRVRSKRLHGFVQGMDQGLGLFIQRRRLVRKLGLAHLLSIAVGAGRLWIAFGALGIDIHLWEAALISCLTIFSFLVSLTPANLGIREGLISFSAHLLGLEADLAMLAALVDRAAAMTLVFTLGFVFSRILLKGLPPRAGAASNGQGGENP